MVRGIIADLCYMFNNIREFGFSWKGICADLAYLIENLTDPTREKVE